MAIFFTIFVHRTKEDNLCRTCFYVDGIGAVVSAIGVDMEYILLPIFFADNFCRFMSVWHFMPIICCIAKRKQVENLPHYREKTDRLLFRLVNHLQPRNMLEVGTGSGLSARYMSEAKHVPLYTFDEGKEHEEVISLLKDAPEVDYRCGNVLSLLRSRVEGQSCPDIVHIAFTPYYKEAFDMLLPYVTSRT